MAGGHAPGTGLRATSEFPAGWSDRAILDALVDVAKDPDGEPFRQCNGRWCFSGTRDGVDIDVLVDQSGAIHGGYPTGGDGVRRNPESPHVAHPTRADLTLGAVIHFADRVFGLALDRLPAADVAQYAKLHWAGEREELADAVTAQLSQQGRALTLRQHADLNRLLHCFPLPLPGYEFINDRDRILLGLLPGG